MSQSCHFPRKNIMTEEELLAFVEAIGRCEVYDEIRSMPKSHPRIPYPRYFKAIMVTLEVLGYDRTWIEDFVRPALEKRYLHQS